MSWLSKFTNHVVYFTLSCQIIWSNLMRWHFSKIFIAGSNRRATLILQRIYSCNHLLKIYSLGDLLCFFNCSTLCWTWNLGLGRKLLLNLFTWHRLLWTRFKIRLVINLSCVHNQRLRNYWVWEYIIASTWLFQKSILAESNSSSSVLQRRWIGCF